MNTTANGQINYPTPRRSPAGDNLYYKQTPQGYVPYAPANPVQPYGRAHPQLIAGDDAMLTYAIVGLAITIVTGLPVGLFTGPAALGRANRLEQHVRAGRRPPTDRSNITAARICAWISIVWSTLSVLVIALMLGLMLMVV
jgi:hypothetical protein